MWYISFFCRACLVGVFIASMMGKIGHSRFRSFVAAVRRTGILPVSWSPLAATAALLAELVAALLLTVDQTVPVGAVGALFIFLAYTSVLLRALLRPEERISCHCFSDSSAPVGLRHLTRNLFLCILCVIDLVVISIDPLGRAELGGIAVSLLAAALVVFAIRYMDEIVPAFSPSTRRSLLTPSSVLKKVKK